MYLSKVEILGFKSFAQKTLVQFKPGITSIVGPNGCGKTNIVDAIRWVLGEQKSSALRSDKMENVIFNGTSARKPMGMAEVSLTIQNTKGILDTEYTDVTITRRIFRSGESEYLLNKNICRLKDITNLFLDTGIGANAYSVIELKMVETILSNKADERRIMFEEAAGVNKYKLRRRLALRKLDEVKSDLTRVNDIVSEVEKKVNSLERQAKRADKYNRISLTLRELELDLAEREIALFSRQKEDAKKTKDEEFSKKLSIESDLNRLDDQLKEIKTSLSEIEHLLQNKRNEITSVTKNIYDVQKLISVSEERKNSLDKNIARYKQELEELHSQLHDAEESILQGDITLKNFDVELSSNELNLKSIEESVILLKEQVENKKDALNIYSDKLLESFKEITGKENDLSNIERNLEEKNDSIARLNSKIQTLTGNIAKTVGFIEELGQERAEADRKLSEAEALYSSKQKEKAELENRLNELRKKELEDQSVINSLSNKINFIRNLIDNLEGVSKGAKSLIENTDWAAGEKILLAHSGNCKEDYRFAIEAALRNNLNNVLIQSLDDLKNGIEYLKKNEIGRASFFLKRNLVNQNRGVFERLFELTLKRKAKKISLEKGFIGWCSSFIHTEDKWKPFFDDLLGKTAMVDSFDTALALTNRYKGFSFVTLSGDMIDSNGIVDAGSEPKIDDSLFGRKQLLEKLERELPQKQFEMDNLRRQIEETLSAISNIDLKVFSERGRMLINDLSNVEKQIARFEFEKNKASDEIEKARHEIQQLAADSNQIDNKRQRLLTELESLNSLKLKAEKEKENLEIDFKASEDEYNRASSLLNSIILGMERLKGEKRNTKNSIKRAQDSIENIKRSISKRELDISSSEEELSTIAKLVAEKKTELQQLEDSMRLLVNEENEINLKHDEIKSRIDEIEKEQSLLRKERDLISELIHSAEMKISELTIKISNISENITESYSHKPELKHFDDLDSFNFAQRTEEVHNLKQQIKNLGPINLLAYSEFEEEKERLDFLLGQRNDLIESEKDVLKTIAEINSTAQKLFLDTFEKIRENFIQIFRTLFDEGDEADLRLEDNTDPLESKIEIIAKPKGKRPTSIELLSGGEKTLTAIALLFAIYLVKPSPFCILDEIDAPLDDANIDRFTRILNEFKKDTQFIVVTHNKRTMESAESLYGVTMQEEGVSKIVSVRFNEDLSFAS